MSYFIFGESSSRPGWSPCCDLAVVAVEWNHFRDLLNISPRCLDLHINTVFQTFLLAISPSQSAYTHLLQEEEFIYRFNILL